MFPYVRPQSLTDVTVFMAGLGATKTTTVRKGGISFQKARPVNDIDTVSWITFKHPAYTQGPTLLTWYPNAFDYRRGGDELWAANIEQQLPLSSLDFEDSELALEHRTFTILDRLADLLATQGYARAHVAATVTLYTLVGNVWDLSKDETPAELFRCAAIAALPQLTPDQQLDCAPREIEIEALTDLLDRGMPYLLAQEMFPQLTDA